MNKSIFLTLVSAIFTAVVPGCRTNSTGPSAGLPGTGEFGTMEKAIAASDNSFGFKLFAQINTSEQNKNVFISPFSVSTAFGMLLNGANGPTLDSLEQALGDAGMSLNDINTAYKNSSAFLTTLDAHVIFQNANSIWYRDGFPVLPDFLSVNKNYFDADVDALDFTQPSAAQAINNWVDTKTNGKIPTIISDKIPSGVVMYLINAIYFKGTWTYTFDSTRTTNANFTCADGSLAPCRVMSQENTFAYYGDNTVQAIDLPYGDRSFSMTVVLPAAGTSIDQFASALTQQQWNAIINKLDSTKVDVYLPKFTLNFSRSLKDDLTALGMRIVFDPSRADLSRISQGGGLSVSDVLHKTYVDVNEEGTEAAAVTVIVVTTSAIISTPVMRIDHPFIFAIREHQSGTILFIGKVDSLAGS
jgi:serpin B